MDALEWYYSSRHFEEASDKESRLEAIATTIDLKGIGTWVESHLSLILCRCEKLNFRGNGNFNKMGYVYDIECSSVCVLCVVCWYVCVCGNCSTVQQYVSIVIFGKCMKFKMKSPSVAKSDSKMRWDVNSNRVSIFYFKEETCYVSCKLLLLYPQPEVFLVILSKLSVVT